MPFSAPDEDVALASVAPSAQNGQQSQGFTTPQADQAEAVKTLASDKTYDPFAHYAQAQESAANGDVNDAQNQQDLAFEVYKHRYQNPESLSVGGALSATKNAVGGLWDALKGAGKMAKNAKDLGSSYLGGTIGSMLGDEEDADRQKYEAKRASEIASSAGQAGLSLANLADSAATNVKDFTLGRFGAGLSDQELRDRFNRQLLLRGQAPQELASGNTLPNLGIPNAQQTIDQQFAARKSEAGGDPAKEAALKQQISDTINSDIAQQSGAMQLGAIPEPVFNNPVTRGIAGGALRVAGKAVGAAGELATPSVTGAGTLFGIMGHNPAVAAGSLASRWLLKPVTKAIGDTAVSAGDELITGVPGGGNLAQQGARKVMQAMATGGVTGAGFAISSDNPNDAVGAVLGGAAAGPVFLLDPTGGGQSRSEAKAVEAAARDKAAKYDTLRQFGDQVQYGDSTLDTDHQKAMQTLSKRDQDAINTARGFFAGMTTPDGDPVRIYALTPDQFMSTQQSLTGQLSATRGFMSDGSVYLNSGYSEPGQATRTSNHETGHIADTLADTIGSNFAQHMRSSVSAALTDGSGKPIPEFQKFIDTYSGSPGMSDYLRRMPERQRVDYLQSEFIAETVNHILSGKPLGEFATSAPIMDSVREGVSDFMKRLGIFPKGKDATFNWQEIPQVTARMRDLLNKIGGTAKERVDNTSVIPDISSQTPPQSSPTGAPMGAPSAPAPTAEPAQPMPAPPAPPTFEQRLENVGIDSAAHDAARDYHVGDPKEIQPIRGNSKKGIIGQSREDIIAGREKEWDSMFSDLLNKAESVGADLPSDPMELHQLAIQTELSKNAPSINRSAQTGLSSVSVGPSGEVSANHPEIPESSASPQSVATTIAQPSESGGRLSGLDLTSERGAQPAEETAPEARQPSMVVTAEDISDRAKSAEDDAKASPEYAKKRNDKTRQDMVRKSRTQAILDAATESAGDDKSLLQKRDDNGLTYYSGRLDPDTIPAHRALLDELGVSKGAENTMASLGDRIGKTLYIDYGSAPKEVQSETSGTKGIDRTGSQRQKEYGESPAAERIAGGDTLEQNKAFVPVNFKVNPGNGSVTVTGFSPQRLAANVVKIVEHLGETGPRPYSGANDPNLAADMQAYAQNHAHGWQGDGSAPISAEGVTTDPNYSPHIIPANRFDVLNSALQGQFPPSITNGEAGLRARELAQANNRSVDMATGHTNPLSAELDASGKFRVANGAGQERKGVSQILEPVYETLKPELIRKISEEAPTHESSVRPTGASPETMEAMTAEGRPNQKFVNAGFMPDAETNENESYQTKRQTPARSPQLRKLEGFDATSNAAGAGAANGKTTAAEGGEGAAVPAGAESAAAGGDTGSGGKLASFMPNHFEQPTIDWGDEPGSGITREIKGLSQHEIDVLRYAHDFDIKNGDGAGGWVDVVPPNTANKLEDHEDFLTNFKASNPDTWGAERDEFGISKPARIKRELAETKALRGSDLIDAYTQSNDLAPIQGDVADLKGEDLLDAYFEHHEVPESMSPAEISDAAEEWRASAAADAAQAKRDADKWRQSEVDRLESEYQSEREAAKQRKKDAETALQAASDRLKPVADDIRQRYKDFSDEDFEGIRDLSEEENYHGGSSFMPAAAPESAEKKGKLAGLDVAKKPILTKSQILLKVRNATDDAKRAKEISAISAVRAALQGGEGENRNPPGAPEGPEFHEARKAEIARLVQSAKDNGVAVRKLPDDWDFSDREKNVGGAEHDVFEDKDSGRFVKITKPSFGLFPVAHKDWWTLRRSTPEEYFQKVDALRDQWGVDTAIHGVHLGCRDEASLIVSQPTIGSDNVDADGKKIDPSPAEIRKHMLDAGFGTVGDDAAYAFYNPDTNTFVADAHPGNMSVVNGKLTSFDSIVTHPEGKLRALLEKSVQRSKEGSPMDRMKAALQKAMAQPAEPQKSPSATPQKPLSSLDVHTAQSGRKNEGALASVEF